MRSNADKSNDGAKRKTGARNWNINQLLSLVMQRSALQQSIFSARRYAQQGRYTGPVPRFYEAQGGRCIRGPLHPSCPSPPLSQFSFRPFPSIPCTFISLPLPLKVGYIP